MGQADLLELLLGHSEHRMRFARSKKVPSLRRVSAYVYLMVLLMKFIGGCQLRQNISVLTQASHRRVARSQAPVTSSLLHQPMAFTNAFSCQRKHQRMMFPHSASQQCDEPDMDALFRREILSRQFQESNPSSTDGIGWVQEVDLSNSSLPEVGTVLLANPDVFLRRSLWEGNSSSDDYEEIKLLAAVLRTGWSWIPQMNESPRRDRACLPVVLIRRRDEGGTEGLMLGCWSGSLLGDVPQFDCFLTRPLYYGTLDREAEELGLSMLHGYPEMPGAICLGEGLGISYNYSQARDWVSPEGPGSSLRFKFFYGHVSWSASEAMRELSAKSSIWIPVRASTDLLLREPDSSFEEPLWVQLVNKVGGNIAELARKYSLLPE